MASPAIDLSAGLQAKPASASPDIDLSAGLVPATPAPAAPAAAPTAPPTAPDGGPHWYDTAVKEAGDVAGGVKKGLNESGLTGMKVLHAIPGVGAVLDHTKFGESQAKTAAIAAAPNETAGGTAGYAIENIIEFMSGEEALKGLSMGAKLAKIAPVLQQLEKYPRMARVLSTAISQGTVGAAQGAAHGEGVKGSLETGAITGLTGGAAEAVIPGVTAGIKRLVDKVRPGTAEIAGETVPVLASQRKGAAGVAAETTTADAPQVAAAQQAGGQRAVENIAQQSAKDSLERVNAVRKTPPITDPARLLGAPEGSQPFQFYIDGPPASEGLPSQAGGPTHYAGEIEQPNPAHEPLTGANVAEQRAQLGTTAETVPERVIGEPSASQARKDATPGSAAIPDQAFTGDPTTRASNWQYTPPEAGGEPSGGTGGARLVTSDPRSAQSALTRYEDAIEDSRVFEALPQAQQAHIVAARDSLQEQLGMYHAGQGVYPHFDPIDSGAAIQHVTNFGEAADQIEAAVKPIYQKLDQVSGGQFTALRNQAKAAAKVMFQPGSIDAYAKALDAKKEADQGIQELFTKHGGDVNRAELTSANGAWRDASILNNLHATIEGAFRGAPKDIADSIGSNRLIRGNSMTSRLNTLLAKTPRADIERAIGADGLHNLYRVADLLSKPETAARTNSAAREIGRHLFRATRGAVVGGLIGHVVGQHYAGSLLGAGMEDAARYVLRQAAINPRIGVLVDRAVRHQVSPKIFAPLIAATLNHDPPPEQQQETQP